MENESILHDKTVATTMRRISKLGVYLPGLLLIIVIIIAFTTPKKDPKLMAQQAVELTPTAIPTPTIKIDINLRGPFTCQYTTETATISAAIKNKQLAADFVEATQESHFVIKGDCLYSWNSIEPAGAKQCGLGQVLDTADLLSSMGFFDLGSLLNMVPSTIDKGAQKDLNTSSESIQKFLQTCVKVEPKADAFTVPTNRVFIMPTVAPTP